LAAERTKPGRELRVGARWQITVLLCRKTERPETAVQSHRTQGLAERLTLIRHGLHRQQPPFRQLDVESRMRRQHLHFAIERQLVGDPRRQSVVAWRETSIGKCRLTQRFSLN